MMSQSEPDAVRALIQGLISGQFPSDGQMEEAIASLMDGKSDEISISALLTSVTCRGETVEMLAGAARAMFARASKIPTKAGGVLDTCGTGGDGLRTFNISTAVAIAVAACGVPVAKHGNRSVSSSSGSADVLEALGVNLQLAPSQVADCVDEIGIGFCFAPLFHQAMKHVAPVRKKLGFRTIFNLLGPLTNPADAQYQLIGTGSNELAGKMAGAIAKLGRPGRRTFVVCGNNELDEVSLWGTTAVYDVQEGEVYQLEWSADSFGLPECEPGELVVEGPQESASVIRGVFEGCPGAARSMVQANGAAALFLAGKVSSLKEGVSMLEAAIRERRVQAKLEQLVSKTQEMV